MTSTSDVKSAPWSFATGRRLLRRTVYAAAVVLALASTLTSRDASAQPMTCGTRVQPEQWPGILKRTEELQTKGAEVLSRRAFVPITIHVVRTSAGADGVDPEVLWEAYRELNALFTQPKLTFVVYQVRYVNSDALVDLASDTEWGQLIAASWEPHTVNCYFVRSLTYDGGVSICGIASLPNTVPDGQAVIINYNCASQGNIWAHEMGHYFDLLHTHETDHGVECPDGSNCAVAGDLLCDTPADPDLSGRVDPGCIYDGSATTPSGCNGTYAPDATNIMSYSLHNCLEYFSPQQRDRMVSAYFGTRTSVDGIDEYLVYIDYGATGTRNGTYGHPYNSLSEAFYWFPAEDFVFYILRADDYPETPTIDRSGQFHLWDANEGQGTAVIGQ